MKKYKRISSRLLLAAIILTLLGLIMAFGAEIASAEKIPSIENGQLVVRESPVLMRVPNVPDGISAEDAYKLVTGKEKEMVIEDKDGKEISYSFNLPFIKARVEYSDKVVAYKGKWQINSAEKRFEDKNDIGLSLLCLLFPALIIVSTSIGMAASEKKGLFIFYILMIVNIFVIMGISAITKTFASGLVNSVICVIATIALATVVGKITHRFLCGLASFFVNVFAASFVVYQDHEIVLYYVVFLVVVEAISFGGIHLVKFLLQPAEIKAK